MTVKVLEQGELQFPAGVMIVDFAADWCAPCKAMMPILQQISEQHPQIEVSTVDISKNMDLAKKYRIATVPCLVVFKDGKEVDRAIGFSGKEPLEKLFTKHS